VSVQDTLPSPSPAFDSWLPGNHQQIGHVPSLAVIYIYKLCVLFLGISSASSSLSLTDSDCSTTEDPRIGILKGRVHQIAKAGLEMFDVSSPKELQDYLTYLTHKMDSAGTQQFILRIKRAVPNGKREVRKLHLIINR